MYKKILIALMTLSIMISSFTALAAEAPNEPNVRTEPTRNTITINWNRPDDDEPTVLYYTLSYSLVGGPEITVDDISANDTSYTVRNLETEKRYKFILTAYGEDDLSTSVTVYDEPYSTSDGTSVSDADLGDEPSAGIKDLLGGGTTSTSEKSFDDVGIFDWFYKDVAFVYENNIMSGVSDTHFSPNTSASRAMIWTILARIDGATLSETTPWYVAGQNWAIENGISDGSDPLSNISRQDLVSMLYRYLEKTETMPYTKDTWLNSFQDSNIVSEYAKEPIKWVLYEGILTGKDSYTLDPKGTASRAEVSAIIHRFLLI